jgi:hypothetical protein
MVRSYFRVACTRQKLSTSWYILLSCPVECSLVLSGESSKAISMARTTTRWYSIQIIHYSVCYISRGRKTSLACYCSPLRVRDSARDIVVDINTYIFAPHGSTTLYECIYVILYVILVPHHSQGYTVYYIPPKKYHHVRWPAARRGLYGTTYILYTGPPTILNSHHKRLTVTTGA